MDLDPDNIVSMLPGCVVCQSINNQSYHRGCSAVKTIVTKVSAACRMADAESPLAMKAEVSGIVESVMVVSVMINWR